MRADVLALVLAPAFTPMAPLGRPRVSSSACEVRMIFGQNEAQKRAIEEQWEAQQAMLNRRRNPAARVKYFNDIEERRKKETNAWYDKLAWQRKDDDSSFNKLDEFKRRQSTGKVKKLGYEDQPKGGIPMPMASFGVGGEFGVGGKYDNGERFDLRLPYVDMGWVDPKDEAKAKSKKAGKKGASQDSEPAPGPFDWLFGKK
mmetsp:Transcript_2110/g.5959  ORF Transcript_2110/g.5959 Transcript_2110/m.5959 type:complete len:201 (-) Transcript_2110:387-989(-)